MPITWAIVFLPVSLLLIALFTLGVGLFISAFAVFFVDIMNLYSILLRLLMYLSGLFYVLESLPLKMRTIIIWNPIYHMITLFRFPIYEGRIPPTFSIVYFGVWTFVSLVIGLIVFTRLSDEYVYRV
jgi:ABC-type polysaccharide/polyol phosphate export permease